VGDMEILSSPYPSDFFLKTHQLISLISMSPLFYTLCKRRR